MSKQTNNKRSSATSQLTRRDLTAFDGEAVELVLEMMDAGWTGRISQRGHAIMRAPGGDFTHSVSRDSLRGRSGRNARSFFERWKRTHVMANHPSNESSNDNVIQLRPDQGAYQDVFHCEEPNCDRVFSTGQGLAAHRKSHNAWVTCPVCGMPAKVLGQHFRFHHTSLNMADVLAQAEAKPIEASVEPQEVEDVETPVEDVAEAVAELEAAIEAEPEPVVEPPVLATILPPDVSGLAVPVFEPEPLPEHKHAPVEIHTTPVSAMDALLRVLTELEALREENARLREWVRNHV